MSDNLSHYDEAGRARMVDVSAKSEDAARGCGGGDCRVVEGGVEGAAE